MSATDLSDFDAEYVETFELIHAVTPVDVQIEKLGGGTVGRAYAGTWRYRVASNLTTRILVQGQDLETGTPKTHAEVARLVLEFLDWKYVT